MKTIIFCASVVFGILLSTHAHAATADARIKSTLEDSDLSGSAQLSDTADGLLVVISIEDAPPGTHGVHIHQKGSCEDGGKAAGGHFNPAGRKHFA